MVMKKISGLTLLELLVTLSIISILTLIAYPSYQHHLTQTYRTRAIQNLLLISKKLYIYYLHEHSYQNVNIDALLTTTIKHDQRYHYSIENLTVQTYQLIATPLAQQAKNDQTCGKLFINQFGEKDISGDGKLSDCWPT